MNKLKSGRLAVDCFKTKLNQGLAMKTKDKILFCAADLFNETGATMVTTNDIAKALSMSPGNLYFHFKNKEQIIREIFKRFSVETFEIWKPQTAQARKKMSFNILNLVEKNLELYWKYRFFHREMYILRKKDPELSKLWHRHLKKMRVLMIILYKHWVKSGHFIPIATRDEMEFVGELLFVSSNSFMLFFETKDRGSALPQRTFNKARRHLLRMLKPYLSGLARADIEIFFNKPE